MSKVQVDTIVNKDDNGAPNFSKGLTVSNNPILAGSASSTGTLNQRLQVTGNAYISGSVGVGTTNPSSKLDVFGGNVRSLGTTSPSFIVTPTSGSSYIFGANTSISGGGIYDNTSSNWRLVVKDTTGDVGIGTTNPTSELHVVGGDSRFGGVIETVSTATTYLSGSALVLEMDVRQATTYTYTMPAGANIGIVSFKNMPSQTNRPSGSTITLLVTQNSSGTGNTTVATGIGTNITVVGYENGAPVAGITTRALVSFGSTIALTSTGNDREFVSFFIHYTGGTNTTASSYQVYATKNGGFR